MNYLNGTVCASHYHDGVALIEVTVGDIICSSMLIAGNKPQIQYQIGDPVTLCFKEFEVAIARDLQGIISLSNRIPCYINAIQKGEVMTRLVLEHNGNMLTSVISSSSAIRLALQAGDKVEALIKANEMSLLDRRC